MIDKTNYNKHARPRGMPNGWPILTAEDINQNGDYYEWTVMSEVVNRNCACLYGWVDNVTVSEHTDRRIATALRKAIKETLLDKTRVVDISIWSDRSPKAKVARVWNRAGALLGYTEGNPMANRTAA